MRQIINFNDNWTFLKPGETAAPVTLPHTWNAIDGQAERRRALLYRI